MLRQYVVFTFVESAEQNEAVCVLLPALFSVKGRFNIKSTLLCDNASRHAHCLEGNLTLRNEPYKNMLFKTRWSISDKICSSRKSLTFKAMLLMCTTLCCSVFLNTSSSLLIMIQLNLDGHIFS